MIQRKRSLLDFQGQTICYWCGITESDEWITTDRHGMYCSYECFLSKFHHVNLMAGVSSLMASLLLLAIFPPVGILLLSFVILQLYSAYKGRKHLHRKGRYGTPPDIEIREYCIPQMKLHYKIHVVCNYCNHLNEANKPRCHNCGASLQSAELVDEKSRKAEMSKCPHCSAVYIYKQSAAKKDGTVKCQNCDKSFIIEGINSSLV